MRTALQWERWLFGIFGFLLGLVGNLLANELAKSSPWAQLAFYALVLAVGVVVLALSLRARRIAVKMYAPKTLEPPVQAEYKRRGIIAFVSLYTPMKDSPASQLPHTERDQAIQAGDYTKLDLEHSNLAPAIAAISSHAGQLEHCWLISTLPNPSDDPKKNRPGSLPYAKVLAGYLKAQKSLNKCEFYTGERYAIPQKDDALMASKTRDAVEQIFRQARDEFGLKDRDIVADFTGCPRSMPLGMILACLDSSRDIQCVGAVYNDDGSVKFALAPTVFEFEPQLEGAG